MPDEVSRARPVQGFGATRDFSQHFSRFFSDVPHFTPFRRARSQLENNHAHRRLDPGESTARLQRVSNKM